MIGAQVFAKELVRAGIKEFTGVPGDFEARIYWWLLKEGIEFVNVRHEQSGGFMAGTRYKLTGNVLPSHIVPCLILKYSLSESIVIVSGV